MIEANQSDFLNSGQFCIEIEKYFAQEEISDITTSESTRIVFIALYSLIFVFGVCGNCLVMIAVARTRQLQTVRNFFIVNLSLSDTVVCMTSLPVTCYLSLFKEWIFGETMCYVIPLCQCMSIIISTFSLASIAIDRFVLIMFPGKFSINKNLSVVMIVAFWIIGAALSIPMLLNTRYLSGLEYPERLCGYFCDEIGWRDAYQRQVYGASVLMLQFAIPLIIICFCYSMIVWRLNRSERFRHRATTTPNLVSTNYNCTVVGAMASSSNGGGGVELVARRHKAWKRKRRTNQMLILMVCLFACAWFLQVLTNIARDFGGLPKFYTDQNYFYSLIAHCIAMTSVIWNPFLYGFLNETFRKAFVRLLPCLRVVAKAVSSITVRSKSGGTGLSDIITVNNDTSVCHQGKLLETIRSSPRENSIEL